MSSAGSAVVDFASDAGQAASDTIVEIVTLGSADTETYNQVSTSDSNQDAIDQTLAANEGSSFNDGVITSSSGETLDVGTNVTEDTIAQTGAYEDLNGVVHSTAAARDAANEAIAAAAGPAAMDDAVADFYASQDQSSLLDQATEFVTGAGQAALDTLTEIATLGGADTVTHNTTENNATENNNTILESIANTLTPNDGQTYVDSVLVNTSDAIDATVAANEGSSYDAETGKITGADGSTIGIGTNVDADDITDALYSELLPGGSAGSIDDFQTRYETTAAAAALDPYGSTTATGFLVNEGFTADLDGDGVAETYSAGTEYTVNTDGSVVVADSEGDTTGGLSLLGESMIELGLADPLGEGETADGSGMTDLTQVGGGDSDGIVGGGGLFSGEPVDDSYFLNDSESQGYSTNLFGTRDIMGDFYGGRSGGMWDRFLGSYLTRFGYSPEQFDEMVRKVENPDGSVNFFGADGQLINPESIGSNYRLSGDPTVLKIGEEDVAIGSQDYDAAGNLISTSYTDAYNPDLDADILAQNQVYSVTDPASGQLVTFPNQAQYDQFVAANNAALAS